MNDLCRLMGLVWTYQDGAGVTQTAPIESRIAVLAAMGIHVANEADAVAAIATLPGVPQVKVVAVDTPATLTPTSDWVVKLDTGERLSGGANIPLPALPLGIHSLITNAVQIALLAAPTRLPPPPRRWGMTLALYGLWDAGHRTAGSYTQLGTLAEDIAPLGASFIGINPIHAGFPTDTRAFSPYAPSHRRRWSTLHIDTGQRSRRGAQPTPLIDYTAVFAVQNSELTAAFAAFPGDPAFDQWRIGQGKPLEDFAVHQTLSEIYGSYWTEWPAALQSPDSALVRIFRQDNATRISFHAWAQWMAETQLAAVQSRAKGAGMGFGLYLDLAVGTHPSGAETWADPDLFARGVSLGAPPDLLGPSGQRWNLAPMLPRRMQVTHFKALAETLRQQLRFSGLLRIDHILGFDRAFWLPDGLPGLYVTMPREAMLAVVRIEAARAGATVIGEDLGTIPDGLRDSLADAGILGCRVAMFERDWQGDRSFLPASAYPETCLSSFGTHDLPTWAGWRTARDVDWRKGLGEMSAADAKAAYKARISEVAAFDALTGAAKSGQKSADPSALPMHKFLAECAAPLVALQADDLLNIVEQPNLPGTVYDHPNWRRRLPVPLSELSHAESLRDCAAIMAQNDRTEQ
jgi:4-alpha-glucanotransferase